MVSSTDGRILKRADPTTIQNKFLVGYQGWFTCAGDGPPVHQGHHGWLHWFNFPIPDGGRPNTDLWPDVSEYSPEELYPAPGLTMQDGSPALLFSSRHPKTVRRHFHWMAKYGVDGCFLQRFVGQCEVDGRTDGGNADLMRLRDEIGDRVRESAEQEGRVWAIMYDVSGVPADRIERAIKVDWSHLVNDKRILESPNYLRENGRPVIALWGFGFAGRGHSPDIVRSIVRHLRNITPGGAYIMAGAPTHWQTLKGDADPNPEFLQVWYNEFDAISPWTVGRYHNEETIDRFAREKVQKDIEALKCNAGERHVDYIPVVFPGGSGFNLSQGKWGLNEMARDGGRFLWRQLFNIRKAGVNIIYGAMWDEYDEGTAFLPVVSKKRQLPGPGDFLALDADGYDLPPDWYMRICGFIGEVLRGEQQNSEPFPVKDLQDFWSSRPKYEPNPIESETQASSSSASGSGATTKDASQSFEEWCKQEKEGTEDLPPPPYTLEPVSTPTPASSSTPTPAPVASGSSIQRQDTLTSTSQPPPVPSQSRPMSLPVATEGRPPIPLSTRPSSSEAPYWNQPQGSISHQPSLRHRPTSMPSSPASQQRPGHSPAPGEIYHHHHHHHHQLPQPPNWDNRPTSNNQGYLSPQSQSNMYPNYSVNNLSENFGRQSLQDPATEQYQELYTPQTSVSSFSAPLRPPPTSSWPPSEWETTPQAPPHRHPSVSSRPPQPPPPPPPLHPSTRPPTSPDPGRYRPPSSAPFPTSDLPPVTSAGSGDQFYAPVYGNAPPMRRPSTSESSSFSSAYPNAFPAPSTGRQDYDYNAEIGAPGGFYLGPSAQPMNQPVPGSFYPPTRPPPSPRPPTVSIRPGQIMPSSQAQAPGGFVSDVSSNAYNYAMGAVGTIAGPKTRRRVESSVDSLSSASCRMYQRFRN